jgi:uncharacterized protein (TIGR02391 family)
LGSLDWPIGGPNVVTTLKDLVPTADDVVGASPADLAHALLLLAKETIQNGMFYPDSVPTAAVGIGAAGPPGPLYGWQGQAAVDTAVAAGWQWLRNNNLIVPAPGINGRNGWMVVMPEGARINSAGDLRHFREAAAFPKELLHADIAQSVHAALMRGRYDDAVRDAFLGVEVAVRAAAGLPQELVGDALVRRAFDHERGPLTDLTAPVAERQGMAHLFAGAMQAFRNAVGHRRGAVADARTAQDQVLLASHLLRIVDARRGNRQG